MLFCPWIIIIIIIIIITRWFKYDRDWFVCKQAAVSPGHIWTTLYCYYILYPSLP